MMTNFENFFLLKFCREHVLTFVICYIPQSVGSFRQRTELYMNSSTVLCIQHFFEIPMLFLPLGEGKICR